MLIGYRRLEKRLTSQTFFQLPKQFVKNLTWQREPQWLQNHQSHWPPIIIQTIPVFEFKPTKVLKKITNKNKSLLKKYSTIRQLTHVIVYELRFINNVSKNKTRLSGHLTVSEFGNALRSLF